MGIDRGIVAISPFGIDVPVSSQRIRFCPEMTWTKMDSQVELGKVFRPSSLMSGKLLCSGKVLEVLMVSEHINGKGRSLEIMTPNRECSKDSKQFLVVSVIVEFGSRKGARMKGYGMDFIVGSFGG